MDQVVILAARRYSFEDEGRRIEGTTVSYLTGSAVEEPDRRGLEPLSVGAPVGVFNDLTELPGCYEAHFRHKPGKGGKVTLELAAVKCLGPAALGGKR